MDESRTPQDLCHELSADLRDMGTWLFSGRLTEPQFRHALLALEAEKVKRFGFTLAAHRLPDGRTHFELRFAEDNRLCASMNFDSETQQLTIEHICG